MKALEEFPTLKDPASPLSKKVLSLREAKKLTPSFFKNPQWPYLLAKEAEKAMGAATPTQYAIVSRESIKSAVIPLQEKSLVYSNRNHAWGSIPKELDGFFFAQGTMRNPKDINVEVLSPGVLYCAFQIFENLHKANMKTLLADGWEKCDFSLGRVGGVDGGHLVLSKRFSKGPAIVPWVHPNGGSLLIFKAAE